MGTVSHFKYGRLHTDEPIVPFSLSLCLFLSFPFCFLVSLPVYIRTLTYLLRSFYESLILITK